MGTEDGKQLSSYKPEWETYLTKIEDFIKTHYNVDVKSIEVPDDNIEENKGEVDSQNK